MRQRGQKWTYESRGASCGDSDRKVVIGLAVLCKEFSHAESHEKQVESSKNKAKNTGMKDFAGVQML